MCQMVTAVWDLPAQTCRKLNLRKLEAELWNHRTDDHHQQLVPVSARVQELQVLQRELGLSSQLQREVADCKLYLETQRGSLSLSARVRIQIVTCGLWLARSQTSAR